jgi:hypothetical protein
MGFDLFDPILYIIKGSSIVYRIRENNAHGSPIVGLSDGLETLLPSGVPNLQLHPRASQIQHLCFEINA